MKRKSVGKKRSSIKFKNFISPLKPGDLIDVVAPGSACSPENLQAAVQWLMNHNFKVRVDADLFSPQMYLSHTDEYRLKSLKKALQATDSKAVWCVRGGYGSLRLLPELDRIKKRPQPKLFIGLSDITSLHLFLNQKWGWPTLHASLLDRVGQNKLSATNEKELFSVLLHQQNAVRFENLQPLNKAAQTKKKVNAFVVGGNLVTWASSLGTPYQFKIKTQKQKPILFLEEIGERGYRVDRLLQQLKQSQQLEQFSAVVFGDFIGGDETNGANHVWATIENFCRDLKIPAMRGIESGHADLQRPVFFNSPAILTCGPSAHMIIYSPYETN